MSLNTSRQWLCGLIIPLLFTYACSDLILSNQEPTQAALSSSKVMADEQYVFEEGRSKSRRVPKRDVISSPQKTLGIQGVGSGGGGVNSAWVQSEELGSADDFESDKDTDSVHFSLSMPSEEVAEEREEEPYDTGAAEEPMPSSKPSSRMMPRRSKVALAMLPSSPPPPPLPPSPPPPPPTDQPLFSTAATSSSADLSDASVLKNAEGLFSNMRTPSAQDMNFGIEQKLEESKGSLAGLAYDRLDNTKEKEHARGPHPMGDSIARPSMMKTKKTARFESKRRSEREGNFVSVEIDQKDSKPSMSYIDQYLAKGAPDDFWPKQGYFRNTYLGGDLSYREEVKQSSERFKHLLSKWYGFEWSPPLDPPSEAGMSLIANLSHTHIDRPQRVILQVALKGSERYGWRRPALNMMVVIDPSLISGLSSVDEKQRELIKLVLPVLSRLDAADQVGLTLGRSMISPRSPSQLKEALIEPLKSLISDSPKDEYWLEVLMKAGDRLNDRSADPHRAPGAQAVLMICGLACALHMTEINSAVHRMNLEGTLTSVIEHLSQGTDPSHLRSSHLWRVASTGHGGFWQSRGDEEFVKAVNREFDRFSRVVARLLRLSVKLGKDVELIEVIGSEMLNQAQVKRVKAREEAMDQRLSARLGIRSDRGEDDEGVQVVIPAFYGGDSHLIHLALWVKSPSMIAEVQLKYKDMVRAQNASFAQAVRLSAIPQTMTTAQTEVREGANSQLGADLSLKMIAEGRSVEELPSAIELKKGVKHLSGFTYRDMALLSRGLMGRPRSEMY